MHDRDRIALVCCAVTLGFCALAFGGAVRWAAIASTAGAVITAAVYIGSRRFETKLSPLLTLIGIAIALTAIQLVPLPVPLALEVVPAKLELVTANAQAWGTTTPKMVMASYDPPATLVELAKLCGYAALAFAACRISTQRRGRRALAQIVAGTAVLVAVVTLGHAAFGVREIYGVFGTPGEYLLSPIVNDNHLASLLAMAVPLALGLGLTSAGLQRLSWLVAAVVCIGVTLLTVSRGGALGLLTGIVVTVAILIAQRRSSSSAGERRSVGSQTVARFIIGGCVVVLVGLLTASQVVSEFESTRMDEVRDSHSKFQVWVHAVDMLEENHWLGIGRGAFEPAFTRWSEVGDRAYSHAENSYLQTAFDWGVPGALAIAFATAIVVYAAARRWRQGPLEAGALGAAVSVLVHDVADFSLELPVVAMMLIIVLAILLPARVGSIDAADGRLKPIEPHTRWRRSGLIAAALVVCFLAATPLGKFARAEADDIKGTDPTATLDRAAAASARHPADYLLLGRAAQALMELDDPRAAVLVTRALSVNPNHAGLHHLAAQLLIRSQHAAQAKVEFSLALRFASPELVTKILTELVAIYRNPEETARALPVDLVFASSIIDTLGARQADLDLAYANRLALLIPDNPTAELMVAHSAIRAGRGDLASPAARVAFSLRPNAESSIALARASVLAGDIVGGIEVLRQELASSRSQTSPDHVELLAALADLEFAANNLESLAHTLDELGASVPDKAGRIDVHRRRADLDLRRGNTNQAAWERAQIDLESRRGP